MHARRGCSGHPPADPRVPLGAPRRGEHTGAHPVAGDLAVGESQPAEDRPRCCMAEPWGHGSWIPPVSASAGVDLGESSVFRRFSSIKIF